MIYIIYLLFFLSRISQCTTSPKRGLVYVPNKKYPSEDSIWDAPGTDLTWYYNYQSTSTSEYDKSNMQFVPMLWGQPSSSGSFYNDVKGMIDKGMNITYVLGFNEPDGTSSSGGSNIQPDTAAAIWLREIEPLKNLGIKLGSPATQGGSSGTDWLASFFYNCQNCTIDFVTVHWYGDFEGMASHCGELYANFGKRPLWVTEFALANTDLQDTQSFYNQSVNWLDNLTYVFSTRS